MTVRFIHSSDLQLGMSRWYPSEDAHYRSTQDRIDAIRRSRALAAEHDAQFMVVDGDVFESNKVAA
jgi:DNA repair exonuclease SbcCD nuclease subunit